MANITPLDRQVAIISALVEGCSIRSTERMTDTHRDTIMRLTDTAMISNSFLKISKRLRKHFQTPLRRKMPKIPSGNARYT